MNKSVLRKNIDRMLYLAAAAAASVAFCLFLYMTNTYARSIDTDTFGHLFKINFLYHSILDGVWYPKYTMYWYNGMELFRYWPPFSYYVVAVFQFLTGGDVLNAFYLFSGFMLFLNLCGWFLFGIREDRLGVSFLMGLLFFLCPDNIRVFLAEGNIPRVLITSLLPFAFYFVHSILKYRSKAAYVGLTIVVFLVTITHYMIAAMLGISLFLFCGFYSVAHKQIKAWILITVNLGLTYISTGLFLLPGVTGGGILSQNSESSVETINQWAQKASISLNPMFRMDVNHVTSFYFGVVVFGICILGLITAEKDNVSGFLTMLFIFVCTTRAASAVIKHLPLSQVFWMTRFVPMAMCAFFLSMVLWKKLRKGVLFIMVVCLLTDSATNYQLFTTQWGEPIHQYMNEEMEGALVDKAVSMTENRLGFLDFSLLGATPSYYISRSMDENAKQYSFGWAYQGALTVDNIVSINEAAEKGCYLYAFDRLLELGDDTVLVYKEGFERLAYYDEEKMRKAAEIVGYQLMEENERCAVFHIDVPGTFGVKKQYKNLAIGENARIFCYAYPVFGYDTRTYLEDYTVEELSQYDKLYLSGFHYHDKKKAEEMLAQVADNGTRIYLEMQNAPLNPETGRRELYGVTVKDMDFSAGDRLLLGMLDGEPLYYQPDKTGEEEWRVVKLVNCEEVIANSLDPDDIVYVGYNHEHDNIVYLGMNLVYYYVLTQDPVYMEYYSRMLHESEELVCESRLVPMEVSYEPDRVTITCPEERVNTGISNLDCFEREDGVLKNAWDKLLIADAGTTVYEVHYARFRLGAAASLAGAGMLLVFWIGLLFIKDKKDEA